MFQVSHSDQHTFNLSCVLASLSGSSRVGHLYLQVMIVAAMFSSCLFLQLPGDLQREGEGPAEEEIHSDLQPESQGAPKRWAVCGR